MPVNRQKWGTYTHHGLNRSNCGRPRPAPHSPPARCGTAAARFGVVCPPGTSGTDHFCGAHQRNVSVEGYPSAHTAHHRMRQSPCGVRAWPKPDFFLWLFPLSIGEPGGATRTAEFASSKERESCLVSTFVRLLSRIGVNGSALGRRREGCVLLLLFLLLLDERLKVIGEAEAAVRDTLQLLELLVAQLLDHVVEL